MEAIRHGGALDRAIAQHGGRREDWLDLSTGINPVAYPVGDIAEAAWRDLPDDNLLRGCLDAARAYYGVPESAGIMAAPGTQAIIQWLPILFNYLDRAAIVSPTYGEYARVLHMAGVGIETPEELPRNPDAPLVVVGQPNNPDGRTWPVEQIMALGAGSEGPHMVVVDEAFADVAPEHSLADMAGGPGLLVLKSFGKFFGLAGLRLGFAIGDTDVIASLTQMIGPWAVSGPALAIGARALADRDWIAEARARLSRDSARLASCLERAGMTIVGRTDLFVLAEHGEAGRVAENLAAMKILVRSFDGTPRRLRFGLPANPEGLARLEYALAEIRGAGQDIGS